MSTRNLFALFVGIDTYQPPIPSLAGCVNDMVAMRDFIRNRTNRDGFTLHEKTLMNEQATRLNIIQGFEHHLAKAGPNDVAFFYYSGHGSQEPAHKMFWEIEPDRMNETIVCYDSRQYDGMDLADKELSTLLEIVSKRSAHVLVIMDCCNSGSGTRAINDNDDIEFMVRQSEPYDMTRYPDSYILLQNESSERNVYSMAEAQQLFIPRARHVALSAAQSFELAKETRLGGTRRGVFTYSLLEVLTSTYGTLTYSDIMRRVSNLVTQRTFDQNPQLYSLEPQDINLTFLGGAIKNRPNYYLLDYDNSRGWVIDGGAIHGILPKGLGGGETVLSVFPEESSEEQMRSITRSVGQITVKDVFATESNIELGSGINLDPSQSYYARITSVPVNPMQFYIKGSNAQGIALVKEAFQRSSYTSFLQEVASSYQADYILHVSNDISVEGSGVHPGYIINRPTDLPGQPLVEQLIGFNPENAHKAIEYLNHIARWTRILELSNPGSQIASEGVRIQLFNPRNEPIYPTYKGYTFEYSASTGSSVRPQFKVKLINTSPNRLYCVMLYMSSQFGIETQLFNEGGYWLDKGEEVWVADGQVFTGEVPDSTVAFGKNEVTEVFKLIVSTEEYQSSNLRQDELSKPKQQFRDVGEGSTRALLFSNVSSSVSDDWNTNLVAIRLKRNP